MKGKGVAEKLSDSESTLEKLLHSFESYYNVQTNGVEEPFSATAEFHSHTEQYFLVKEAHIADIDSNDYVYFIEEKDFFQSIIKNLSIFV